jgi:hypothetical protein
VNPVDSIAFYGIPGLFGPGIFQFRDFKTASAPRNDYYIEPVAPACCVTLSLESLAKADEYMKEQHDKIPLD